MKMWEIGYLAGMIDAECHVGIQKWDGTKGRKTPPYSIHFELAMTDETTVNFVNSILPESKLVKCAARGRRLPYFRLRLKHQQAIKLLELALPYLQGKKYQVQLCLKLDKLRKKYSPSRKHPGKAHFERMPEEFVQEAEAIYLDFRKRQLNKKPRKYRVNE